MPDEYETEIIFVNDGSTDQSATVIKRVIAKDKRVHFDFISEEFWKGNGFRERDLEKCTWYNH